MSYLTLSTKIGAELAVLDTCRRLREHARLKSNAGFFFRLLKVANGYDPDDNEDGAALTKDGEHFKTTMGPGFQGLYTAYRDILEAKDGLYGVIAAEIAAITKEDIEAGAIAYEYLDTDGAITIKNRKGSLGGLWRQMTTDGNYVEPNVVTPGGLTAQGGNVGLLTGTALTAAQFYGNCPSGVITVKCVDQQVARPKFSVQHKIDMASILGDGQDLIDADQSNRLTLEKAFHCGMIGLKGIILSRSGLAAPVIAGDGFSILSLVTVTNPQDSDSTLGVFYVTIHRDPSDVWVITIYSDSGRTNQVGQVSTSGTAGSVALTAPCGGGSSIAFTFSRANAHANLGSVGSKDDDISIDIKHVREGDTWTFAVTNGHEGKFMTKMMRMRRFAFPDSGSSKWTDTLANDLTIVAA